MHYIVMSEELKKEYGDHFSEYGFEWYVSLSREGRVISPRNTYNPVLRTKMQYGICFLHCETGKDKIIHCWSEISDDIHLIETAIITDNFIISDESHCHEHLSELVNSQINNIDLSNELGTLIWVRPNSDGENFSRLIDYLANNTKIEDEWYVVRIRR